jgi:hypothetical protein
MSKDGQEAVRREIGTVPALFAKPWGKGQSLFPFGPAGSQTYLPSQLTDRNGNTVPRGKKVTGGFNEQA